MDEGKRQLRQNQGTQKKIGNSKHADNWKNMPLRKNHAAEFGRGALVGVNLHSDAWPRNCQVLGTW
jgi:hypothetical protein